jgi:hypothetical protein
MEYIFAEYIIKEGYDTVFDKLPLLISSNAHLYTRGGFNVEIFENESILLLRTDNEDVYKILKDNYGFKKCNPKDTSGFVRKYGGRHEDFQN